MSNIGFLTASVLGAMITALFKPDPGSTLMKVLIMGTKNLMTCDDPYIKGSTEWEDKSRTRETKSNLKEFGKSSIEPETGREQ